MKRSSFGLYSRNQEEFINNLRPKIYFSDDDDEEDVEMESLECRVCGGPAHGYNFDQISCESCKAFFRRNALRYMPDLKCRFSGCCEITVESRRLCTYCRLKKCFDVKMRKEWIRSEEDRQLRKLKRLNKQDFHMDQFSIHRKKPRPIPQSSISYLTSEEWSLVNSISEMYDLYALENNESIRISSLNSSSLTNFLNNEEKIYKNLIEFFKQIQQFRQINLEDQILLIKCNITHLVHIHHVLKDNFIENPQIGLHMSQWINIQFHQNMSKNRQKLNFFIQYPFILKISLIIFIFSINLSRLPSKQLDSQLKNPKEILDNQHYFLNLLIKYINTIFNGKHSNQAIQILVFQYLQYQLLMDQLEQFIDKHLIKEQFYPLTKSVLRLT